MSSQARVAVQQQALQVREDNIAKILEHLAAMNKVVDEYKGKNDAKNNIQKGLHDHISDIEKKLRQNPPQDISENLSNLRDAVSFNLGKAKMFHNEDSKFSSLHKSTFMKSMEKLDVHIKAIDKLVSPSSASEIADNKRSSKDSPQQSRGNPIVNLFRRRS